MVMPLWVVEVFIWQTWNLKKLQTLDSPSFKLIYVERCECGT